MCSAVGALGVFRVNTHSPSSQSKLLGRSDTSCCSVVPAHPTASTQHSKAPTFHTHLLPPAWCRVLCEAPGIKQQPKGPRLLPGPEARCGDTAGSTTVKPVGSGWVSARENPPGGVTDRESRSERGSRPGPSRLPPPAPTRPEDSAQEARRPRPGDPARSCHPRTPQDPSPRDPTRGACPGLPGAPAPSPSEPPARPPQGHALGTPPGALTLGLPETPALGTPPGAPTPGLPGPPPWGPHQEPRLRTP